MKKIYMRAGISPLDEFDPSYVLLKNSIGNNVGNLIYAYSMFRTLTTENTVVTPNYYQTNLEDADMINSVYDYFVIPLADAFRPDFIPELKKMTQLINSLKIPCIVTGVGIRAPFEPGGEIHFPYDQEVKKFIKAVLNKSSIIGVRGEITSTYLSGLGFQEERDHTVIGCPSMYTYGRELNIRNVNLTTQSRLSINSSVHSPITVQKFLSKTIKTIPDYFFLPQRLQELRLLYLGHPYNYIQDNEMCSYNITDSFYANNRVRFFLRASEWINFLKTVDMSIGGRLHGNIAATIAGTPCILIPHDARMRELTSYHSLTHVWAKDISEQTDIFELASKLDFKKVTQAHGGNFDHFIRFLELNGLPHIYSDGKNPVEAPLDIQISKILSNSSVKSIFNCSIEEMAERWKLYYPEIQKHNDKLKQNLKKSKEKVSKLEETITNLNNKISDLENEQSKTFHLFGNEYTVKKVKQN